MPSAFQEARKAKRASGALSLTLAVLMLVGFAARCALSAAVVFNSDAYATLLGLADLIAGRSAQPARVVAQGLVWVCAVGLGALNCLWLGKVLRGAAKVVMRSGGGGKRPVALTATAVANNTGTANADSVVGPGPQRRRQNAAPQGRSTEGDR